MEISCPIKNKLASSNKKTPWISNEIKMAKRDLLECYGIWRSNKDDRVKKQYNKLKKDYRSLIKNSKAEYYLSKINNSDNPSKTTWQIINSARPSKVQVNKNLNLMVDGNLTSNPQTISNGFNTFFSNIAESIDLPKEKFSWSGFPYSQQCTLSKFSPCSKDKVKKIIGKLSAKKSTGLDGISMELVKFSLDQIIQPLTDIINTSLNEGVFPDEGKTAIIKPIFKKGDPQQMDNYRPISLLPAISKVIEKVVCEELITYLETNHIYFINQFGFRKGKSTKLALVDFVGGSIDAIESGDSVLGCFVDLSKAFDCVDVSLLTEKIASLGICGTALKWLTSYASDRRQITSISSKSSTKILSKIDYISSGVPQGSVLGPVLFLIYINDINQHISDDRLLIFADDTTIITKNKSINNLEQDSFIALNTAGQYFSEMGLKVNPSKTTFVHFQTSQAKARRQVSPNILFGDTQLEESDHVKYLGANIDSCFLWDVEVKEVANKLSKGLFVLRSFSHLGNEHLSKVIYFSLIECHIRYSIILWGSSTKQNLNKIFILQKRAIRCMAKVPKLTSCINLFKKLGILTVPSLYIFEAVLFVKNQNLIRSHTHHYQTRNRTNNSAIFHRKKLSETSPVYYGQKFFHVLPEQIKQLENPQHFKTQLHKYLLDQCYYTLPNLNSISNHNSYHYLNPVARCC